jgi:hypothetical protein
MAITRARTVIQVRATRWPGPYRTARAQALQRVAETPFILHRAEKIIEVTSATAQKMSLESWLTPRALGRPDIVAFERAWGCLTSARREPAIAQRNT